MELRTSNIIMLCKGRHTYGNVDSKTAIKKYMAEICAYKEEWYDDKKMIDIIKYAVLDYIETADYPRGFLFDYFEAQRYHTDAIDAWLSALRFVQVKRFIDYDTNVYVYVNGFTEENINVINENTGKPMFNFEEKTK